MVQTVVNAARGYLPDPNLLFRCGPAVVIAALPSTNREGGSHVALQIANSLAVGLPNLSDDNTIVNVGVAVAPQDGVTLDALLAKARVQQTPIDSRGRRYPSVH